jgi:hypothetical protein
MQNQRTVQQPRRDEGITGRVGKAARDSRSDWAQRARNCLRYGIENLVWETYGRQA